MQLWKAAAVLSLPLATDLARAAGVPGIPFLHLDAANLTLLSLGASQEVVSWTDRSGMAFEPMAPGSVYYEKDPLTGLGSIRMNGGGTRGQLPTCLSNEWYSLQSSAGYIYTPLQNVTFLAVYRGAGTAQASSVFEWHGCPTDGSLQRFLYHPGYFTGAKAWTSFFEVNDRYGRIEIDTTLNDGNLQITTGVRRGSYLGLFNNGTLVNENNNQALVTPTPNNTYADAPIFIGPISGSVLYELIIWKSPLSDSQLQDAVQYAQAKWLAPFVASPLSSPPSPPISPLFPPAPPPATPPSPNAAPPTGPSPPPPLPGPRVLSTTTSARSSVATDLLLQSETPASSFPLQLVLIAVGAFLLFLLCLGLILYAVRERRKQRARLGMGRMQSATSVDSVNARLFMNQSALSFKPGFSKSSTTSLAANSPTNSLTRNIGNYRPNTLYPGLQRPLPDGSRVISPLRPGNPVEQDHSTTVVLNNVTHTIGITQTKVDEGPVISIPGFLQIQDLHSTLSIHEKAISSGVAGVVYLADIPTNCTMSSLTAHRTDLQSRKGNSKATVPQVAVKIFKFPLTAEETKERPENLAGIDFLHKYEIGSFKTELSFMYAFQSNVNVVKLLAYSEASPWAIVMAKYEGDLEALIYDRPAMPFKTLVHHLTDIAHGLQAVSESGVAHLDLKPKNILYERFETSPSKVRLVVSDFGLARLFDSQKTSRVGGRELTVLLGASYEYSPPETFQAIAIHKSLEPEVPVDLSRADVFSVAMLTVELLDKHPPWNTDPFEVVEKYVRVEGRRPTITGSNIAGKIPKAPFASLQSLLGRMWAQASADRPSFFEVLPALTALLNDK